MKRALVIIAAIFIVGIAGIMVEWPNWQSIAAEQTELESYDSRDGKKEAEADIARGNPKWKVSGRISDPEARAARLKQLGIEMDWFGGCIVTEGFVRYRYEYNSTIRSHFVRLVGENTVRDVIGLPLVDDRERCSLANSPTQPTLGR